ncbi:MAG TPA: rubrerythrin family protein [Candidatus Humimicrobiaceae bacterium]|nr:rubrerythrin family protein [Candidatus Humimicrobiaceae bacterium]
MTGDKKMTGNKTLKNLAEAFAGESQANRKYLAFARKADRDGYAQIARLFRAAAGAETVHALNHLKAMDGIKSTEDNLKAAVEGETFEFRDMYPKMIEEAKSENSGEAKISFTYANKVEQVHAGLYKKYLDSIGNNPDTPIFVCQVCGNTVEGAAPDVCPICGNPKEMFKEIA